MAGIPTSRAHEVPPRQHPYDLALKLGIDALLESHPSDEKLAALGASRQGGTIRVPALNWVLLVDTSRMDVFVEGSGKARRAWAVLCVHYLAARDFTLDAREVAFGRFSDARSYVAVYQKRIVGRFLATSGSTSERFVESSEKLAGERLPGSGVRYRFRVLPRVPVVIVRYEGDEEFGPGANIIYQADSERLLPAEDRVVSAELLLDALAGKTLEENVGGG